MLQFMSKYTPMVAKGCSVLTVDGVPSINYWRTRALFLLHLLRHFKRQKFCVIKCFKALQNPSGGNKLAHISHTKTILVL